MNPESEFYFGPHYERGLFGANGKLTRLCKGNSSTQSNPNNSTTINDDKISGGEGSITGNSGAVAVTNVTNTSSVDAGVVGAALGGSGDILASVSGAISDASAASSLASESASYNASQAAIKAAEASARASESASYNASKSASDSSAASSRASEASSYNSSEAAKAAADASERVAYEAGQVSLKAAQAATAAAEKAAYESSRASAAAAASAQKAASDALMSNEAISRASLSANVSVTRDALFSVDNAVNKSIGGISDANKALKDTAYDVLQFRATETTEALDFAGAAQKQAADLIRYTNEQFTSKLANNAGDAPQATVEKIVTAVAVGAVVIAGLFLFRGRRAA